MKALKFEIYHLLVPVSVVLLGFLVVLRNQTRLQFEVMLGAALVYLGLSFAHHHNDKSLTIEVMLEYILIAALSLIILQQFLS